MNVYYKFRISHFKLNDELKTIEQVNDALIVLRHFIELNEKLLPILLNLSENSQEINDAIIYPNPTNSETNVNFYLQTKSDVNILVTDLSGKTVSSLELTNVLTGSNSVGDASVAGSKMTRMVWRRIVNNLPLLLKSKGTKRSVQALLSCYGIPESLISINEYGGPSLNKVPTYEKYNFDYSLDLINNASGTVTIDYTKPIGGVELRFRLDDVTTNPTMPSNMNLITISGSQINVKLNFTKG
jgi:hypothetical protein